MSSPGRLRRFLHLERARREGPTAEATRDGETETGDRISGVERPSPAARPVRTRTGADLTRFGPEPEPTLELVETEGRPAFIRCRRCGRDNNVFATECAGCTISLGTPEQHEFDERFWAARQAEAEREAAAARQRLELQARAQVEEARQRRAMGEELAREVGRRERRRLDGWLPGGRAAGPWQPLGLRLVRLLVSDPSWHLPALGLAVVFALAAAVWGVRHGSAAAAIAGIFALIGLLAHAPG
jgi:ribosomal protein L37E